MNCTSCIHYITCKYAEFYAKAKQRMKDDLEILNREVADTPISVRMDCNEYRIK